MPITNFDNLTECYEAMIDWPKRLANEGPFFREWFEKFGVQRMVDVACGTGRHADMFSRWGMHVEAADLSPAMIAHAKSSFPETERLRFVVRPFDEPIKPQGCFDAAVCIGNSLALANDLCVIARTMNEMFAAVRAGGLVIVHVLNAGQLPDGPCVWQKCKRATLPQGDVLILKGVHRVECQGFVEFLIANPSDGTLLHNESAAFLGLESSQLEEFARNAGAKTIHFFGDYHQTPYDPQKSIDLLMVAGKR